MKKLSHLDRGGKARMVDVSGKTATAREAVARGFISVKKTTLALIRENEIAKGDVLGAARISAIMAAKKTPELIPLCHPLPIASVSIDFTIDEAGERIVIESRVKVTGQTGVEMEALTAVSVAALTIYDMCKAIDKEMVISDIMLIEKTGGKSGPFRRREP
ncbi:MAG TPA: cyclic pyranopterin monophosphate synthase MoaC [Thermodesulfovibrionales bacterium]|nr:cyclic pyranopterin monophosphate synthase MoaC [Thermodesulfovibrionales bacterium]